ncbi:MAG: response regulator [Nitrosopumilus sp.]|nr:response regulator [Nitrosopumilus sp.]
MILSNRIKVIIIEGEQDLLYLYREFLSMKGYSIIFTDTTTTNLLNEYKKYKPDVIIIDYDLLNTKNNIEPSKKIIDSFPDASILMISAIVSLTQSVYKEQFFKDKKIEFLFEPIKLQMLEKSIKILAK